MSTFKKIVKKSITRNSFVLTSCLLIYLSTLTATANNSPVPGEIVATYRIPSEFNSLNGLAWDGSHLWAADYRNTTTNRFTKYLPSFLSDVFTSDQIKLDGANVYRLDVYASINGEALLVVHTLNLGYPEMEGLAHDGINTLLVGPRADGTRAGAKIIAVDKNNNKISYELADFLWPDGEKHGNYKDPDGIAYGEESIFWLTNAGHSDVPTAAIQMMKASGEVIKRFWLPDKVVNDIAYVHEHIVYKPENSNVIHLVRIDNVDNGDTAKISKAIPISNGEITGHWGVTYDAEQYLYVSQDPPGGIIWKIYLPKSVFE